MSRKWLYNRGNRTETFSFNSPYGACPECEGIGVDLYIDPKLVVPNDKKTLIDGAIVPWSSSSTLYYAQTLSSLGKHYNFTLETPWRDLPKKFKILFCMDQEKRKLNFLMMMDMKSIQAKNL